VRDFGWPVHVPRPVRDRAVRVRRGAERLEAELGRAATVAEVADECDLTSDQVLEAMEAEASARLAPLNGGGDEDGDDPPPDRSVGVDEDGYELVEYRDAVAHKLSTCSDRDRLMLRLRLVDGLSQREIANRVGLSQMHVSRLLRELLEEPNGEHGVLASGRPRASKRRRVQ
jgi:RNA polymerase sigma-B factor